MKLYKQNCVISSFLLFISLMATPSFAEQNSVKSLNIALRIEYGIGFSTIYFQDYKTIRSFAGALNKHPDSKLELWGHTDSVGTKEVNQELSEARAEKIKEALIKFDVAESRIITKGFSEDQPVATNSNRFGRAKNRRTMARVSGLSESELKNFKRLVENSNLMALVDEKGAFLNANKSFESFYETQAASMETGRKVSRSVANIDLEQIKEEVEEQAADKKEMQFEPSERQVIVDEVFEEKTVKKTVVSGKKRPVRLPANVMTKEDMVKYYEGDDFFNSGAAL